MNGYNGCRPRICVDVDCVDWLVYCVNVGTMGSLVLAFSVSSLSVLWRRCSILCTAVRKCKKVRVKFSRYRPGVAQSVGRGIALHFHDRGTRSW